MNNAKFNYYLSEKKDVIKMLKSYIDSTKQQEDENSRQRALYENEIIKIKNNIQIEENIIEKTNRDRENKRYSIWKQLDNERKELIKKRDLDKENIQKKEKIINNMIPLVIIIIVEVWIAVWYQDTIYMDIIKQEWPAWIIWLVMSPITIAFYKLFYKLLCFIFHLVFGFTPLENFLWNRIDKINKEYKEKITDVQIKMNTIELPKYTEDYYESCRKIEEAEEQISSLRDKIYNIGIYNYKSDLRKKYNIPKEIIGYEEVVYNLLINNRVNSFNEALDKVEVYRHREYVEEMQHQQYLETENLKNSIERELDDINNNFNNKINEVKNLASEAASSASEAVSHAKNAAYDASNAAYDASNAAYYAKKATR